MILVAADVADLVEKEYKGAKKKHGPMASLHEGYAVLLEELEEAETELDNARQDMARMWFNVTKDISEGALAAVADIHHDAIRAACEAIQVAAVCKRITDLVNSEDMEG